MENPARANPARARPRRRSPARASPRKANLRIQNRRIPSAMIEAAIACLAVGFVACVISASLCIRPAMKVRALVLSSANHPAVQVVQNAGRSFASFAEIAARLEAANRSFDAAAVSIDSALTSVGAYASQVATMAIVVDGLLELVVPRLRMINIGTTEFQCRMRRSSGRRNPGRTSQYTLDP
jgi:cytochrome c biogenesis protein CcdA